MQNVTLHRALFNTTNSMPGIYMHFSMTFDEIKAEITWKKKGMELKIKFSLFVILNGNPIIGCILKGSNILIVEEFLLFLVLVYLAIHGHLH